MATHSIATGSAPQVCGNCKNGKRKCSKDLPSCARCSKLLLKCDYSYSSQHHNSSAQARTSSPISFVDMSLPSLQSASNWFQVLANLNSGVETSQTTETDISDQVLSIFIENGEGVPSVAHTYFRTIDVWLPIIDREECMKRLETITVDHSIELSCLLICMYLVSQPPGTSQASLATQMKTSTYFQAKALHSALVCTGNAKVNIIQAGVLMSLYEQGHGMIEAAQITMAGVIRLATKVKVSLRSSTDVQKTEFKRLWWGILILDRHMNQILPAEEIHLLSSSSIDGMESMELPVDDESPSQMPRTISARTSSGVLIASQPMTRFGPFCRTAEASNLLGGVLNLVAQSATSSKIDQKRSQDLDINLQKLAMKLLREALNGWEECCAAIGLCLSALLLLHGRTWELTQRDSAGLSDIKNTAQMALSSSTRMVIDICRRFHMDLAYIDLPALPLPATYSVYRATLFYIYFAGDEFMGSEWLSNLDSMKSTLGHFSKRWNIGKQYLDLIDKAVVEKKLSRARTL